MYLCKKCLEKFLSEGERGLTEVETIKEVFCEEN